MLCTECQAVTVPETVLSGSDFAELVAWSCLVVPGYLYCLWRHWNRAKACPSCGSHALMRQSKASRARLGTPNVDALSVRVRNETGPVRWPAPLRAPRERLRNGLVGTVPPMLALLSWLCAAVGWLSLGALVVLAAVAFTCSLVWVIHHGLQLARLQVTLSRYGAWDEGGRALPIELV